MASWTCSTCTFINSPSQKSTCKICLTSSSSSSSLSLPSKPKWVCKACTFLNPYETRSCEICRTLLSTTEINEIDDENDENNELGSSVGNIFLPLQRCNVAKRKNREEAVSVTESSGGDVEEIDLGAFRGQKAAKKAAVESPSECGTSEARKDAKSEVLKVMTYNVWFREDLELHMRMKALGDLVRQHSPDVICFQEVTPDIYDIFKRSTWWKGYSCSVPSNIADSRAYFCMQLTKLPVISFNTTNFHNSCMGRELCVAEVKVAAAMKLVVATSHLESPCPGPPKWDQMFSKERVEQANEAIKTLDRNANVIFCGDMNWNDKLDGQFPLPKGWIDVWSHLRPKEVGYTYDTKLNKMLSGNRALQKRLDRFVCKLTDFETSRIDMIGMDEIPGIFYTKEKKVKNEVKKLELPVLPSDHFGLLLTICPK